MLSAAPVSARLVAVGDGVPPISSERPAAHPNPGRRLATLVLVAPHQIEDAPDSRAVESARRDLSDRQILLDERLKDGIQNFVRRQAVSIFLVGP